MKCLYIININYLHGDLKDFRFHANMIGGRIVSRGYDLPEHLPTFDTVKVEYRHQAIITIAAFGIAQ